MTVTPLDVFYTSSLDAGVSFSPNIRVTSVSFDPNIVKRTDFAPDLQPFMGDYIGIAATPFKAYPLWADNRFACDTFDSLYNSCVDQDAFTAAISLPDFTISTILSTQSISAGSSGTANVTVTSLGGFQGNVAVSSSSSPMGLPINPTSKTLTVSPGGNGSFNLTFATTPFTVPTSYIVNIAATSSLRSHSAQITVIVTSQTVGGAAVSSNQPGSISWILPVETMMVVALSAIVAARVWSRSKRRVIDTRCC